MAVAIRKAEGRDLEPLGRLGAVLMQTHYESAKTRMGYDCRGGHRCAIE